MLINILELNRLFRMAEISLPCFKRQLLLKANVNLKTKNCLSTPLHSTSYMCHENIIELLLDSGAEPQEQDCDGRNALHKCIEKRNQKLFNVLTYWSNIVRPF